jgi:hypothetical protein
MGSTAMAADSVTRGFGFGGAMAMAFFPDMTGINAYMSENGLPSMGDFLIGAGGSGRGGVIGGPVFGGVGWGLVGESDNGQLSAELVSAGGGFDMGRAIGGNDRSVLTVGAVLGGGANVLSLTNHATFAGDDEVTTCGIIPTPMAREIVYAHGFVQPYVSMAAQFLPWLGFELRLGYIVPIYGMEFGDVVGIPTPSLKLSGPTVSFGFAFGGIGSGKAADEDLETANEQVTIQREGSFAVAAGTELVIENALGDIAITGYAPDGAQTSGLVVHWQATLSAKEKQVDELQLIQEANDASTTWWVEGSGRVDRTIQVPFGIDLKVKNGAGVITVVDYEAQTIIIENGAGEMQLQDVRAAVLIASGGVGSIALSNLDVNALIGELGIGEITLSLPMDASAKVIARAGIGDVDIDRFPGMTGGVHGFLGKSGNITLGLGKGMIELKVGIGRIGIGL